VNNAGIATLGNMEWMSLQTVKRVFDVNTFGPVAVTNAFLPLLRKSRGRVVIISSLAGMYVQRYKEFVLQNGIFVSIEECMD
jgi:3-hydroxybutyrate dehydrogenase